MEHEVFVPVPVPTLRELLADPAGLARCVPGFQQDADASADPLSGRLKVRVGGHTITYRGALRVAEREDGVLSVEGEGAEARGTGSAKLALTVRLAPAEGGTTLAFTGTTSADGRLAELEPDAATSAAHRLLDRFAESLAETAPAASARSGDDPAPGADDDRDEPERRAEPQELRAPAPGEDMGAFDDDGVDQGAEGPGGVVDEAVPASVFDAVVPPPALDPLADEDFVAADAAPVEAAHARRTMIGRSAEEVDHAPPRGRYTPTPGPDTGGASDVLRWLAPAAALALASAVVVGRALRRRK
ncbi:SRPBCC domain-containing protein [Streptomyces sp. NPDC050856]|uniref:SRPBCC domain-containing protein n=1 Tax=Streptomyces sp. NPDC050856 TaxID=3154939 RepID=UPI0033C2F77D